LDLPEEDRKVYEIIVTIIEAKNRAYEQVEGIKALAVNKPEQFIETVNEMVQNVSYLNNVDK